MRFSFVGTTEVHADLDPTEFRGMKVDAIAAEIEVVLKSVAPNVDLNFEDIVSAAVKLGG